MYSQSLLSALVLTAATGIASADCKVGEGREVRPMEATASMVEKFTHKVVYTALEKMGYKVAEPLETEYAALFISLANGDGDFTAAYWNLLHKSFYDKVGGAEKVTIVGKVVDGAVQGLLVDKKSYDEGVHNLTDFKDKAVAARFDADGNGKADLAGCTPGWGCEKSIEHYLTELGLRDTVTHNQGSYDALMADVIARFKAGKPIFYFTWVPYWVSGILVPGKDVEWLDVPKTKGDDALYTDYQGKNLGFGIDYASFLVNNKFLADNPPVKTLFESVTIDINDLSAEAMRQKNGESSVDDVQRHAEAWIAEHQSQFDGWVNKACAVPAKS
ncbi:glycine betaine/L-proline ABC transporter substrate-binding protein ProX [Mesorhizobium sp. 128a]